MLYTAQRILPRLASGASSWTRVGRRHGPQSSAVTNAARLAPLLHLPHHRPPRHSSPPHRMCTRFHRHPRFCRLLSSKQDQQQKLTPAA